MYSIGEVVVADKQNALTVGVGIIFVKLYLLVCVCVCVETDELRKLR